MGNFFSCPICCYPCDKNNYNNIRYHSYIEPIYSYSESYNTFGPLYSDSESDESDL